MNLQVDTATLIALLLISARIFTWTLLAPPIATAGIPVTVKTVLSVALSLPLLAAQQAHVPAPQIAPVVSALTVQIALGAGLGFLTRLVFSAVESAGGLIDVFGGFSLSAAYDPLMTTMNSVFGRFYGILATTLIFVTDAHLMILQGFLRTFSTIPLDSGFAPDSLGRGVVNGATQLFVAALQIAGPLIVVLFVADVALGVLNRIAPQLNAFSLSFPIKIGLTLLLIGSGFMLMPQTIVDLGDRATALVDAVTT